MTVSALEWFRDEDGEWTAPEGRRGEFVALPIVLPVVAWTGLGGSGLPGIAPPWLSASLGVCCGYLYATRYRDVVVRYVPDRLVDWSLVSFLGGSLGGSVLELVPLTDGQVAFVLAACATVLGTYTLRLLSPVHRGLEPPRRGVESPASLEMDP